MDWIAQCEDLLPAPEVAGEERLGSPQSRADDAGAATASSPTHSPVDTSCSVSLSQEPVGVLEDPEHIHVPLDGGDSSAIAVTVPPLLPSSPPTPAVLKPVSTVHTGLRNDDGEEVHVYDVPPVSTIVPAAQPPKRWRAPSKAEELARKRREICEGKGPASAPTGLDEEVTLTLLPVGQLSGWEFYDQMMARIHPDDKAHALAISDDDLAKTLGRFYMTEEVHRAEAIRRIRCFGRMERQLAEATAARDKRVKEAAAANARASAAEEELARTKARLAEIEVEKASLESALLEQKRECHELWYKFKSRYSSEYEESKRSWRDARVRAHREGYVFGARDQRLEFFLSPQGHQFLKILFEGTLKAFAKTPELLGCFTPGLAYMITEIGCKGAVLAGATPETVAALDLRALFKSMDKGALQAELNIDPASPPRPEWWYPVLDEAIQQFTVGLCAEPVPEQPIYHSPFLEVLREFVQELSGNPDRPRTFAEFGLYPPQPLSADPSSPPSSREAALARLGSLYRDEASFSRALVGDLSKDPDPFPDVDASTTLPVFEEHPFVPDPSASGSGAPPDSSARQPPQPASSPPA